MIKDDLLVRLCALDSVDIEPLRADLMARLEHHRDRYARYERMLNKLFPDGTATSVADTGKLLGLAHRPAPRARRGGMVRRGDRGAVAAFAGAGHVLLLEDGQRENNG